MTGLSVMGKKFKAIQYLTYKLIKYTFTTAQFHTHTLKPFFN